MTGKQSGTPHGNSGWGDRTVLAPCSPTARYRVDIGVPAQWLIGKAPPEEDVGTLSRPARWTARCYGSDGSAAGVESRADRARRDDLHAKYESFWWLESWAQWWAGAKVRRWLA